MHHHANPFAGFSAVAVVSYLIISGVLGGLSDGALGMPGIKQE